MINYIAEGEWIVVIFVLVVIGVFFMAIREIAIWYWKIDRIVELLEKIEENTRK